MSQRMGKNELLAAAELYPIRLKSPSAESGLESVWDKYMIAGVVEQEDGLTNYILHTNTGLVPTASTEPFAKARKRFAEWRIGNTFDKQDDVEPAQEAE